MAFVGQLDLAEVHREAGAARPALPAQGLLALFVAWPEPGSTQLAHALHHAGDAAQALPLRPPKAVAPGPLVRCRPVACLSLPAKMPAAVLQGAAARERTRLAAAYFTLAHGVNGSGAAAGFNQLGGHPSWINGGSDDRPTVPPGQRPVLLWQIDGDLACWSWGGEEEGDPIAAEYHLFIGEGDLGDRRFDRTSLLFACNP
jgi:hypothetical protein